MTSMTTISPIILAASHTPIIIIIGFGSVCLTTFIHLCSITLTLCFFLNQFKIFKMLLWNNKLSSWTNSWPACLKFSIIPTKSTACQCRQLFFPWFLYLVIHLSWWWTELLNMRYYVFKGFQSISILYPAICQDF